MRREAAYQFPELTGAFLHFPVAFGDFQFLLHNPSPGSLRNAQAVSQTNENESSAGTAQAAAPLQGSHTSGKRSTEAGDPGASAALLC